MSKEYKILPALIVFSRILYSFDFSTFLTFVFFCQDFFFRILLSTVFPIQKSRSITQLILNKNDFQDSNNNIAKQTCE